jgi:hypothetical protein
VKRAQIDAEILAWMREPVWRENEERFAELALALFAHQVEHCAPYRRFCEGRGRTPDRVRSWREIPPVPTGAFKEVALRSFPAERTVHVFRTSGTSTSVRGELHLDTLALYEASLLPSFQRFLLPDLSRERPEAQILVLAPSPAEVRDSSLSHMFGVAIRELGAAGSGFFVEGGSLRVEDLLHALAEVREDVPLLLAGTAFAFVHLLDELEARGVRVGLPASARIMETGGFKGRSRELTRTELHGQIEAKLGVPLARIVNQYGMCELASQFYEPTLRTGSYTDVKRVPPWVRVRVVDPVTQRDVGPGESGVLAIFDLANVGSVLAVLTSDLGELAEGGFRVFGRLRGAEARGCSLAADALLTRMRP